MELITNSSKLIDSTYGVYYDNETSNYKIGNSVFKLIGNNFQINEEKCVGTDGLYQLLFLKTPETYSKNDLTEYGKILKTSSAHKRNFDANGQTKGTNTSKYRTIIKPLIHHTGSGLMNLPKQNVDYVYWNDANEMVERLRLLLSSQQAGNNSHTNEILSIMEELRESNIIY